VCAHARSGRIARGTSCLVLLLALLLPAGGASAAPILNVAHRGYSAAYPENTLVAIDAAFDAGAHAVEIDLQRSADGAVVIFHDDTLDRTTDGSGLVADHTLAELQALDAGSWLDPAFAGEPIPTLEQALASAIGRGPLLLDQKSGLTFGADIASALTATGFAVADLLVTAWEPAQVADVRAQVPGATVIWTALSPDDPTPEDWSDFLADMAALGVDGFSFVDLFLLDSPFAPSFVAEAQALGFEVFAWNLLRATEVEMQRAVDAGLDGYIVDDPGRFSAVLPEPSPVALLASLALLGLGAAAPWARGRVGCYGVPWYSGRAPRPGETP
jgi:glycerophosphoryl diester phosphodiesterase